MLRRFWQALNCLPIHATYCVIIAGASPGETKMWAPLRENGDFFALAVRITGKLEARWIHAALRGVWQALNCLFIHSTFCVIATGASPGQKMKAWVRKNDDSFAIVVRITGKLL